MLESCTRSTKRSKFVRNYRQSELTCSSNRNVQAAIADERSLPIVGISSSRHQVELQQMSCGAKSTITIIKHLKSCNTKNERNIFTKTYSNSTFCHRVENHPSDTNIIYFNYKRWKKTESDSVTPHTSVVANTQPPGHASPDTNLVGTECHTYIKMQIGSDLR